MKKKILIIATIIMVATTILALVGCDNIVNVGQTFDRKDWEESGKKATILAYKQNPYTKEWTAGGGSVGNDRGLDTVAQSPNNYSSIWVNVKPSLINDKNKLNAITFLVKTDVDCEMNFHFFTDSTAALDNLIQFKVAFKANEETRVTISVNKLMSVLYENNTPCLYLGTSEMYVDEDGYWHYRVLTPEVKWTLTNMQFIIEKIK